MLQERLTVRRRFGLVEVAVAVPLLGVLVWSATVGISEARLVGLSDAYRRFGAVVVVLLVILSGVGLGLNEGIHRAEAGIGSRLAHRVARPARVPVRVVLGRGPSALLVVGIPLQLALGVLALAAGGGGFAQLYLLAVVVIGVLAVVGVRRAAGRGTVAVDAVSLAIDERLRTADALGCVRGVPQLSIVPAQALVLGLAGPWVFPVYLGGMLVVYGLWTWALVSQPKRSTPPPLIAGPVGGRPFVPGAGS